MYASFSLACLCTTALTKATLYENAVDDDCGYHEHALRTAIRDLRRLTIANFADAGSPCTCRRLRFAALRDGCWVDRLVPVKRLVAAAAVQTAMHHEEVSVAMRSSVLSPRCNI